MGFNYIKFKFQKYRICVPPRAFLVYFRNRHQHNVTFRLSEEEEEEEEEEEDDKVIKFKNAGFYLQ